MNLDQALELIKQVCADFNGKLHQHENIQAAIKIIEKELDDKTKSE